MCPPLPTLVCSFFYFLGLYNKTIGTSAISLSVFRVSFWVSELEYKYFLFMQQLVVSKVDVAKLFHCIS